VASERDDGRRLLGIGVDGAPGGWVAVACWGTALDDASSELHFFPDIDALASWRAGAAGADAPVAMDIPIGLPLVVGFRECDLIARRRLGGSRMSSVFQVPSRRLLSCATEPLNGKAPRAGEIFERARAVIAEEQLRVDGEAATKGEQPDVLLRLTRQAAGILAKIGEVDDFIRADPAAREQWLFEVHPEMCFRALARDRSLPSKASAHGQLERLELVHRAFPDADERIRAWPLGSRYSLLDICDAYAACWTALRWARTDAGALDRRGSVSPPLEILGEHPPGQPDREVESGLAMRMVI
jgi:predicted RNase H-like nuclease